MADFDVNRDGKLSKREISEAFYRFGVVFSPHDVDRIYEKYDKDGFGEIDYKVCFLKLCIPIYKTSLFSSYLQFIN